MNYYYIHLNILVLVRAYIYFFKVPEKTPGRDDDCSGCKLMHILNGTALGLALTGMIFGCVLYYFKGQHDLGNCLVCFSTAQYEVFAISLLLLNLENIFKYDFVATMFNFWNDGLVINCLFKRPQRLICKFRFL